MLLCLSGCAAVISRATEPLAENLTQAILNHNDPETVAAAVPTYLVLLDSLLRSAPEDPGLLLASATLHSAFAGNFVQIPSARSAFTSGPWVSPRRQHAWRQGLRPSVRGLPPL